MNLSTIDMPRTEARRQFEIYRRAARDSRDAEDKAMAAGYKAIAEGRAVLLLTPTMIAGGVTCLERVRRSSVGANAGKVIARDRVTVPRLAVCRANRKYAWTHGVTQSGSLEIVGKPEVSPSNRRDRVQFGPGSFAHLDGTTQIGFGDWNHDVNALVPPVPPEHRPKDNIANYLGPLGRRVVVHARAAAGGSRAAEAHRRRPVRGPRRVGSDPARAGRPRRPHAGL